MRKGVYWIHVAKYRKHLEGCYDPSGFNDCVEFIDKLRNCWLLKEGFAAWSYFSSSWSFPFLLLLLIVFLYAVSCILFFFSCSHTTESIFVRFLFNVLIHSGPHSTNGINLAPCGYVCAGKTSLHTGQNPPLHPLSARMASGSLPHPQPVPQLQNRVPGRAMPCAPRRITASTAPTHAAPRGAISSSVQARELPHSHLVRRRSERRSERGEAHRKDEHGRKGRLGTGRIA